MSELPISRRNVIASLAVLPAGTMSVVAVPANSPDREILELWNIRQNALAIIESRGPYFYCEEHSPKEAEDFSRADDRIYRLSARTHEGLIAKLWVALSFVEDSFTERKTVVNDVIRRGDLAEVETIRSDLEYEQAQIFSVICDLHRMTGVLA